MALLRDNSYIHLTWEGYKNDYSSVGALNLKSQTRQSYLSLAQKSQNDILKKINIKDINEIEKMQKTWSNGNEQMKDALLQGTQEAIMSSAERGGNAQAGVAGIHSTLSSISSVLNSIPNLDDKLTRFLKQGDTGADSISKAFAGNKITITSYGVDTINALVKMKDTLEKASNKNSSIEQIGTLKNEIVKQAVYEQLHKAIKTGLLDPLQASAPGFSNAVRNETVKKSSDGATVEYISDTNSARINIGLTTKEQKKASSGKVSTVALADSLQKSLMDAALMDSVYEYHLLNILAQRQQASDISQFIAARELTKSFSGSYNGLNLITNLDRVMSLQDLFNSNFSLGIDGSNIGPGNRIPGNNAIQAYIRSSQQRQKFLRLRTSLSALK